MRRDAPRSLGRTELVGGPAAGHEHRAAARHRLQHRHREALAAVRVHQHVGTAVQGREPFVVEVVRQHAHVGTRSLAPAQLVADVHAAVERAGADVLDHEQHVVAALERLLEGGQQHVDALAVDGSADEQEHADLVRGKAARGAVGAVHVEVDAVRHHVDAVGRHAVADVHVTHEVARHPHLVHALQRLHPVARDRAELPRLDQHQAAEARIVEPRRPLVAHLDGGRSRRRRGARVAVVGRDVDGEAVAEPADDLRVDAREARDGVEVAAPAHGQRRRRLGVSGGTRRVAGLEVVDVVGERARRLDRRRHRVEQERAVDQTLHGRGQPGLAPALHQQAVDAVAHALRQAAHAARDHRETRGARLSDGQRCALPDGRRHDGDVDSPQHARQVGVCVAAGQLDAAGRVDVREPRAVGVADLAVQARSGRRR